MCQFFSFVGDGYGNYLYSDWNTRKENLAEDHDSHTAILTRNKVPPRLQDRWSKYEYNPLTKKFTVDQGVEGHDHEAAENWVQHLNFKSVVDPLVIKKIRNPLTGRAKKVTDKEIVLLDQWIKIVGSVRGSVNPVWDSAWASVGVSVNPVLVSVGASVWDSVEASVGASVWTSVRASVWYSVWTPVYDSVRVSVGASVGASVWAYLSSFFKIKYGHDFSSVIKLWNSGFVPSFDGKKWRLHSGKKAEVVYEKDA
jgi:hypothetical protein